MTLQRLRDLPLELISHRNSPLSLSTTLLSTLFYSYSYFTPFYYRYF